MLTGGSLASEPQKLRPFLQFVPNNRTRLPSVPFLFYALKKPVFQVQLGRNFDDRHKSKQVTPTGKRLTHPLPTLGVTTGRSSPEKDASSRCSTRWRNWRKSHLSGVVRDREEKIRKRSHSVYILRREDILSRAHLWHSVLAFFLIIVEH